MPDTPTIDRDQLKCAEHFGTAGPVTALTENTIARWRKQHPDWKAKHWGYSEPDHQGARMLQPINVVSRTKN
ncbi:hypothetical protein [Nocardia sp. CNY236]|uniref:hypothetical protein n=1 Tax=Nocardia sp. CNY236 TaxID=1169152 RepID=UPI0003FDB4C4|nr:hypothetical protein [Nocardia sp. CNY236]